MKALTKSQWIILSPILVVIGCHLSARIGMFFIGKWAFIPVVLTMWVMGLFFLKLGSTNHSLSKWLSKVPGKFGWKFLVLLVGLLPITLFLSYWELLLSWEIFIPYLILALINPFIEEFYWRGLLLDHTQHWKKWQAVLYSTFIFALNHPMSFGMFSELNWGFSVFISTFIMGIIWSVGYQKIGSLRWMVFSHFLVDSLNVSVPAFLDLFKPVW